MQLFERIKVEFVRLEDRFAYNGMDYGNIPENLWGISRFAEIFGINDDEESLEFIKALPLHCLEFFSTKVREVEDELENWLVNEGKKEGQPSLEFLKYTTMLIAYTCASSIIERIKG
ncbi:MAG: hypothetical protein U0176_11960 [Bacteroidia bacterium]